MSLKDCANFYRWIIQMAISATYADSFKLTAELLSEIDPGKWPVKAHMISLKNVPNIGIYLYRVLHRFESTG
jgi:hypothetical protein